MKLIYSDDVIPSRFELTFRTQSMFLAGPTPRDPETPSWRPLALDILNELKYYGYVFIPEYRHGPMDSVDLIAQTEWEHEGLTFCSDIIFWIPRELKTMPAFTTNVEFGRFADSKKTWYGRPDEAPKNQYLDWYYHKVNKRRIYNNLKEMLTAAATYEV